MKHTAYMGLPGALTLPVELPSVAPDVLDNSQIFDASGGRRYGVYNSTLPALRSWTWSNKVLGNKIVQDFYPLTDPVLTSQPWFMLPCGYGVNMLSPTDSALLGSPRVSLWRKANRLPEEAGGGQLTTYLLGNGDGTALPAFQSVPLPLKAPSRPGVYAAGVFGLIEESGVTLTVTYKFEDGSIATDKSMVTKPSPSTNYRAYEVVFPAIKDGKWVAFVSLAVAGKGTMVRPYLVQKDPNNLDAPMMWSPGTGAYSVAVKRSNIWRYSQYASYLDLELVELSQTFVQR